MPTTAAMPATAWGACTKMVEAATKVCAPPTPSTSNVSAPNWDAMANSFAALSAAFTWGSIGLAILAIAGGYAWSRIVTAEAKNEARTEAAKCAKTAVDEWLRETAPTIVRTHVELLRSTTIGGNGGDEAADAIGKVA